MSPTRKTRARRTSSKKASSKGASPKRVPAKKAAPRKDAARESDRSEPPVVSGDELAEALREAWRTSHRITRRVLDATSDEGLRCSLSKRGGRDVARQLAHLHNVRVHHLEGRAKELANGLEKFPTKVTPTRGELVDALEASAERIETLLVDVLHGVPKRRGFRKGIFTTLSYFVSHEAHHRGSILLTLKECGHAPSHAERAAIWGWDQIET